MTQKELFIALPISHITGWAIPILRDSPWWMEDKDNANAIIFLNDMIKRATYAFLYQSMSYTEHSNAMEDAIHTLQYRGFSEANAYEFSSKIESMVGELVYNHISQLLSYHQNDPILNINSLTVGNNILLITYRDKTTNNSTNTTTNIEPASISQRVIDQAVTSLQGNIFIPPI